MEESQLFINQKTVEEALYTRLQQKMLDELQRLSGKVWTDFNAHDPGVTVADIANYALTETDYKLGFSLTDYLTDSEGIFEPEKYGLFFPEKVYPTTPVTLEDYRKLLIERFPNLEKIEIYCKKDTGSYEIRIVPPALGNPRHDIETQVKKFFHENRNLCENLDSVTTVTPPLLNLHSEFEIEPGEDATNLLAQVYWKIMQYLSGSIQIEQAQERPFSKLSPGEWFEGPTGTTRVVIPKQKNTEHDLYETLVRIKGIKVFKTCYLLNNNKIQTDFKDGYGLYVPKHPREFNVRIRIGNSEMPVDTERFIEKLQALYFSKSSFRLRRRAQIEVQTDRSTLPGTYRNVFGHSPVAADLPACYATTAKELPACVPPEERSKAKNFGSYLELFDLVVRRGLTELKKTGELLSIRENTGVLSRMETLDQEQLRMRKTNDRYRYVAPLKNEYLDFLDHLYGVDSQLEWANKFSYYSETEEERTGRRLAFLRQVPELTRTRSKAANIYGERDAENIPTVKKYISYLLDLNRDEGISVGNILPGHNLILMGDGKESKPFRDKLNSMLINEKILDSAHVEAVIMDTPPRTEEETIAGYEELRHDLPIFHTNLISGGLFRRGIDLNDYKLVRMESKEYLLVFWNREEETWMNLGRSDNKKKLNRWANTLRRYLQDLNRQCEALYVMEHNLFSPPLLFTASFIFTGWTARMKSPRFREICSRLVRSLLPAHLKARMYWLDVSQMQYFEENYHKWRKALSDDDLREEQKTLQNKILDILETAKKEEEA